jgi:uncharacterized protein (TIGR01777 family)
METVLITGGTGMIGKALAKLLLVKGYQLIILTRSSGSTKDYFLSTHPAVKLLTWNPGTGEIDEQAIREADHIIHLAGAGVADKRWTAARKREIQESRSLSSTLLLNSLRNIPNNVKSVVSASAIGWYGPDKAKGHPFTETDPAHDDFLGQTCKLWEECILPVRQTGKRLVIFRTGIVLSNEGGALRQFKRPAKFGFASILGSGKQIVSWIHIDDLCRLYLEAITNQQWNTVFNAVASYPVDNKTLSVELVKHMKGRFFIPLPVPAFLLRLIFGELSVEVLKSANITNAKVRQTGFQFLYPSIIPALQDLTRKS